SVQPHAAGGVGGRGAGQTRRRGGSGGGAPRDDPRRHLRSPLHGRLSGRGDGAALPEVSQGSGARRSVDAGGPYASGGDAQPTKLTCRPAPAPSRRYEQSPDPHAVHGPTTATRPTPVPRRRSLAAARRSGWRRPSRWDHAGAVPSPTRARNAARTSSPTP